MHMALPKVMQYQHCLMRHNGMRTRWDATWGDGPAESVAEQLAKMRDHWRKKVDEEEKA